MLNQLLALLGLMGHYHEPYSNLHRGECRVCGVWAASEDELEVQIALLMHVGRVHPEEYFLATGKGTDRILAEAPGISNARRGRVMAIGKFTDQQVRSALRRTRSWFRKHPGKWITTIYYDGRGGYDLIGRFWMELCPNARNEQATTALYGDRVFAVAHDVLRQLVQRLGTNYDRFPMNKNDLKFGRVATIQDHSLSDTDELLVFIQDLERVA